MPANRHRRLTTGLSAAIITCLATASFASPVAAAPDPAKAEQRAEQKAQRDAAKAERKAAQATVKAERDAMRAEKKAELDAAKDERAALRDARKDALEQRKVDAKALREEARATITEMRDGFAAMSVGERKTTLEELRKVREGYQGLFLALMESWRADRNELLPNALSDTPEDGEEAVTDEEAADA